MAVNCREILSFSGSEGGRFAQKRSSSSTLFHRNLNLKSYGGVLRSHPFSPARFARHFFYPLPEYRYSVPLYEAPPHLSLSVSTCNLYAEWFRSTSSMRPHTPRESKCREKKFHEPEIQEQLLTSR